ncbi:MAG: hypothetical protein GF364_20835 [Candidatus Lokiarchaeota archaeon]|nr:hypothetical protein [Candidatus Lokiarchaeota archaeon]
MNKKQLKTAFLSFLLILIGFYSYTLIHAYALEPVYFNAFPLQQYDSRFYVVSLQEGAEIEINVTNTYNGDFDVFIHNDRPEQTYVSKFGYDDQIYENVTTFDTSSGDFTQLNYVAEESQLYYIQVVLISGETDTYHLNSSVSLELYFIPFLIPGYSVPIVASITLLTFIFIAIHINKRIKIKAH